MQNIQRKYYNLYMRIYALQDEIQAEQSDVSLYTYGEHRLELANAYLALGETDNADRLFAAYLEKTAGHEFDDLLKDITLKVLGSYAVSLIQKNDYKGAEDVLVRLAGVLETDTTSEQSKSGLVNRLTAEVFFIMAMHEAGENGRLEDAFVYLRRVEQMKTTNTQAMILPTFDILFNELKGDLETAWNNSDSALEYYRKAMSLATGTNSELDMVRIEKKISKVYAKLEKYRNATECYMRYSGLRDEIYYAKNDAYSKALMSVYSINDTEKKVEMAKAEYRSLDAKLNTDPVTGLYNKHFLNESIKNTSPEFFGGNVLSAVMMDIDYFKRYNDNYGHVQGDKIIKEMGKILKSVSDENVYPIRFGGEEFLILIQGNLDSACALTDNLIGEVHKAKLKHEYSKISDYITISCGVADMKVYSSRDMMQLIQNADEALYVSKNCGRDRYTAYGDDLEKREVVKL